MFSVQECVAVARANRSLSLCHAQACLFLVVRPLRNKPIAHSSASRHLFSVQLPFAEFLLTYQGYVQNEQMMLNRARVRTIGLLLADRLDVCCVCYFPNSSLSMPPRLTSPLVLTFLIGLLASAHPHRGGWTRRFAVLWLTPNCLPTLFLRRVLSHWSSRVSRRSTAGSFGSANPHMCKVIARSRIRQ